jgi:hypothetical protein
MARRKDVNWSIPEQGQTLNIEQAQLAVLMDLRDELQKLNALLHCHNFTNIPNVLRAIRRQQVRPRCRRKHLPKRRSKR